MIQVKPMLNELAAGHQGRIGWINGCLNECDLMSLIKRAVVERGFDPNHMSRLNQLALISDMAGSDYARKHSLLGSARVAATFGNEEIYGTGTERRGLDSKRPGMPHNRMGAYCCPHCIAGDLQQFGFSWYRRFHHLVGVDWCVVHGSKLSRVDDPMPFACVPHMWLLKNKLEPLKVAVEELPKDGFLRRFAEISTKLLERERPFLLSCIHDTLARQAVNVGVRPTRYGNRPFISDHLSAQVGGAWLRAHLPDWQEKQPFSFFHRIDTVVTVTSKPTAGEAYAMAMAALYETAEAAIRDVSLAETRHKSPSSNYQSRGTRGTTYWNREFRTQYAQCYDQIPAFAKRLELDPWTVGRVLTVLGLPNQHEHEPSKSWAALIRFCFGECFSAACSGEQVDEEEVKTLLRKCSGRVMLTIRTIRREFLTRGKISRGRIHLVFYPPPV